MFSWITGPRVTSALEDIQPGKTPTSSTIRIVADSIDGVFETTFVEPPDTPAPQFAVNALKHALFGTPASGSARLVPAQEHQVDAAELIASAEALVMRKTKSEELNVSPSKQTGGILRTPVTAGKNRKTVTFGANVVDNEIKKSQASKSGIPDDCPGKFPSPWTPGTELGAAPTSDRKPQSKLKAALLDARTESTTTPSGKLRTRDDFNITLDLGSPRANSGKYWKEQYDSYSLRSEKEVKRLVVKQQLAKNYAKKKDGEVVELVTKIEQERKHFAWRILELEERNEDLQKHLQTALERNSSAVVEVAALKARIASFETSKHTMSSMSANGVLSFPIHEDPAHDLSNLHENAGIEISNQSKRTASPPLDRSSSTRSRQNGRVDVTSGASTPRSVDISRATKANSTTLLRNQSTGKSAGATPRTRRSLSRASHMVVIEANSSSAPQNRHGKRWEGPSDLSFDKENAAPLPHPPVANSSPLPQGSPDPWLFNGQSSNAEAHVMALPVLSALSHTKKPTTRHSLRKSAPNGKKDALIASCRQGSSLKDRIMDPISTPNCQSTSSRNSEPGKLAERFDTKQPQSVVDLGHHEATEVCREGHGIDEIDLVSEDVSHMTEDRTTLTVDRKAEAKRRLLERKEKRLMMH